MRGLTSHASSDGQTRIHLRVEDEGLAAMYVEYAAPAQLKA